MTANRTRRRKQRILQPRACGISPCRPLIAGGLQTTGEPEQTVKSVFVLDRDSGTERRKKFGGDMVVRVDDGRPHRLRDHRQRGKTDDMLYLGHQCRNSFAIPRRNETEDVVRRRQMKLRQHLLCNLRSHGQAEQVASVRDILIVPADVNQRMSA
ncbi:hypothetical protein P0D88_48310 [Paraburkholderia sp. RL18-103-BIB-C]